MKSVTFKFRATLEFSRRHCNLKPNRFNFCIEYKPIDRTCPFHYQRLELYGLLGAIGIKSSVAFLKCFSIHSYTYNCSYNYTIAFLLLLCNICKS